MEKNTYANSVYIAAPPLEVVRYLSNGMNLNEYTLNSRMYKQIDEHTWLGSASGYQADLFYHVRKQSFSGVDIVEWHCGFKHGEYHHVYPMAVFDTEYFSGGAPNQGTLYHWISFVDPERSTPMIAEGMPSVHDAEAYSLKAAIERRLGHRSATAAAIELHSHSIYIDAPVAASASYFSEAANSAEWRFLLREAPGGYVDEYNQNITIKTHLHQLEGYHVVEYNTHYIDTGIIIKTPIFLIPASYAFARRDASGYIMHRVTAWPTTGARECGPPSLFIYDTEAISAKRILEVRAGNRDVFARGCSYLSRRDQ